MVNTSCLNVHDISTVLDLALLLLIYRHRDRALPSSIHPPRFQQHFQFILIEQLNSRARQAIPRDVLSLV